MLSRTTSATIHPELPGINSPKLPFSGQSRPTGSLPATSEQCSPANSSTNGPFSLPSSPTLLPALSPCQPHIMISATPVVASSEETSFSFGWTSLFLQYYCQILTRLCVKAGSHPFPKAQISNSLPEGANGTGSCSVTLVQYGEPGRELQPRSPPSQGL